jgi:hypothetical protein
LANGLAHVQPIQQREDDPGELIGRQPHLEVAVGTQRLP